ncbi:hypothetical protein [uncultured Tateyamaria sp.]|uniref:hypothetical protein n=1 Tax=uncultured Tateyamaria sp. TaxID=455651 RepID=UPI0026186D87|nr:hypothetical protein [uncultured Tateyamaria sp.]
MADLSLLTIETLVKHCHKKKLEKWFARPAPIVIDEDPIPLQRTSTLNRGRRHMSPRTCCYTALQSCIQPSELTACSGR